VPLNTKKLVAILKSKIKAKPVAVPPVTPSTKQIINKLMTILKSKTMAGELPVSNGPEGRALLEAATKKNNQTRTVSRLISILKSKIKPPTFTQSNNAHGVIMNEKGRVIGSVFLNGNTPGFKVKGVFKTTHNGWSLRQVGPKEYRLVYTAPPVGNTKRSLVNILKKITTRESPPKPAEVSVPPPTGFQTSYTFTHFNNPLQATGMPAVPIIGVPGQRTGRGNVVGTAVRFPRQAAAQSQRQQQAPAAQRQQQAPRQARQTQTPPLSQNAAAQVNTAERAPIQRKAARTVRASSVMKMSPEFKKLMERVIAATTAARAAPNNSAKFEALQQAIKELKNQPPSSELTVRLLDMFERMYGNKNKPPPAPKVKEAVAQTTQNLRNNLTELEKKEEKLEEKAKKMTLANLSLNQLLVYRKNAKNNKVNVNKHIRDRLRQLLSNIRTGPETNRARKYNEILKYLPKNYSGRSDIATLLLDEVRRVGGHNSPRVALQRLSNLRNNIGSFANAKVVEAFEKQVKRAQANMGRRGGEYYSRGNRGGYRGNSGGYRGNGGGYYPPSRGNGGGYYPPARGNGGYYPPARGNGGNYPPRVNGGGVPLNAGINALPTNQKKALEAVPGGAMAANAVINSVPGGQKAIIEAAEALNEFPNAKQAMEVKGISPTAIAAVKKIAGNKPLNAISIVGAVNTLKKKAPKTAAGVKRRRKPKGPRTVEIDRVLARTLKKNLASLVAHNITHTNNIKGTLKKYKKPALKILTKAQILRTKAANRARQSAKKQKNKS
jgi:hypothetical protein